MEKTTDTSYNRAREEKIRKFSPMMKKMAEKVNNGEVPYFDVHENENNEIVFTKKYKTPPQE